MDMERLLMRMMVLNPWTTVDHNELVFETIATHTDYLKDATSGKYSLTRCR